MTTVEPLSLRACFLLPAALLLWSCSGVPETGVSQDDAAVASSSSAADISDISTIDSVSGTTLGSIQDPISQDRNRAFVEQLLSNARRSLELKLWDDVRSASADVLVLDPSNAEARNLLQSANAMLGTGAAEPIDFIERTQVAAARQEFRARQEIRLGRALMDEGQIGDAIERFERAGLIIKNNPFASGNSPLQAEIDAMLEQAQQREAEAMLDENARRVAQSRAEKDSAERRARAGRESRFETLVQNANIEFQNSRFGAAVDSVEEALRLDPTDPGANALMDIATRAQHDNRVEILRQRWKAEWSRTFDDLKSSNVPQTKAIKFDAERWAEVDSRTPQTFTPPDELDSPEERAIRQKLEGTEVAHRFSDSSIQDWSRYYQSVTGVNFFVHPDVAESEEARLTDFNLPKSSVSRALNIISRQAGIKWRINNGLVELLSGETQVGKTYLVQYGVRDLVFGIKNKRGPSLKLRVPGEEEDALEDDEEPTPVVLDDGRLEGLITGNIEPDTWDEFGSLRYQDGVLLVRHTKEVHGKIQQLLSDLRKAVGIQVDIEARFLRVADSFLEEVGIDFRGLGNQASEGLVGRGLEQNNRSNLRLDDFGRPETINPAVPGTVGTGTEPGFFFDDGGDGDLLGRTENLFDTALGGGEDGLTNLGGLSLQAAFLDDVELEAVLRAVQKQERSEEIVSPRIMVYNNTRAHMSALRHTSYIRDFEVEIAQASAVANPIVDVVRDGVVLDVRPVVSADRRFVTMELRPTVMTLQLPIPTFSTTLGSGQPVNIQLPEVNLQSVRTTVTIPDGSTLMLGGMRMSERQRQVSGIPFLQDLPGLSLLFSRKGNYVRNSKLLILIRASIILAEEHAPDVSLLRDSDAIGG